VCRWFWGCEGLFFCFFAGGFLCGPFRGIFLGGRDFFGPLGCLSLRSGQFGGRGGRGPLGVSRGVTHEAVCPGAGNDHPSFRSQRYIGNVMPHCDQRPNPKSKSLNEG
jgi:hypothetical protein